MSDNNANTQMGTTSDTTPSQQIGGASIPPPSVAYVLVGEYPAGPRQGQKVAVEDLVRDGFIASATRQDVNFAQKAVSVFRTQQAAFEQIDHMARVAQANLPPWFNVTSNLSVREFFGIGPDGFVIIGLTDIVRPPG